MLVGKRTRPLATRFPRANQLRPPRCAPSHASQLAASTSPEEGRGFVQGIHTCQGDTCQLEPGDSQRERPVPRRGHLQPATWAAVGTIPGRVRAARSADRPLSKMAGRTPCPVTGPAAGGGATRSGARSGLYARGGVRVAPPERCREARARGSWEKKVRCPKVAASPPLGVQGGSRGGQHGEVPDGWSDSAYGESTIYSVNYSCHA